MEEVGLKKNFKCEINAPVTLYEVILSHWWIVHKSGLTRITDFLLSSCTFFCQQPRLGITTHKKIQLIALRLLFLVCRARKVRKLREESNNYLSSHLFLPMTLITPLHRLFTSNCRFRHILLWSIRTQVNGSLLGRLFEGHDVVTWQLFNRPWNCHLDSSAHLTLSQYRLVGRYKHATSNLFQAFSPPTQEEIRTAGKLGPNTLLLPWTQNCPLSPSSSF